VLYWLSNYDCGDYDDYDDVNSPRKGTDLPNSRTNLRSEFHPQWVARYSYKAVALRGQSSNEGDGILGVIVEKRRY